MSKITTAAIAAAAVLSGAAFGGHAAAMPFATLSPDHVAAPLTVERVVNVCSINGCAPIHTRRVQHPPRNFTMMAVPMSVPNTTPPPKPAQRQ